MILIALGSNMSFGERAPHEVIRSAIGALERVISVDAVSRLYRSPAWPDPSDPAFINAVIRGNSGAAPDALLAALHAMEAGFGRRRRERNGPRTLDLDLLAYGDLVVEASADSDLELPHPRLIDRDFVLAPLCDVAPDWVHPVSGLTAKVHLAGLSASNARPFEDF